MQPEIHFEAKADINKIIFGRVYTLFIICIREEWREIIASSSLKELPVKMFLPEVEIKKPV